MLDNVLVGVEYEFQVDSNTPPVEYVQEQLKTSPFFEDLEFLNRVAPELPVESCVEIITTPLPLTEAISTMHKVFKFIGDVGRTSELTGMHVNVSLANKSFHDKSFNPKKLVTLADEEHIQQHFKLRPSIELIGDVKNLNLNRKKQTINFSNAFLPSKCVHSRVEFRYPGGKDYEKYPKKAENEINRIAQILVDSFDTEEKC